MGQARFCLHFISDLLYLPSISGIRPIRIVTQRGNAWGTATKVESTPQLDDDTYRRRITVGWSAKANGSSKSQGKALLYITVSNLN